MRNARVAILLSAILLLGGLSARAGGPLLLGGPSTPIPGQPMLWPAGVAIQYRVDGGPLSTSPGGVVVINNAAGIARVQAMFGTWQAVPTANLAFQNAGAILATGSFTGGDVKTAQDFDAVDASCAAGTQSPIVFDADGSLFNQLIGDPTVIGFAGPCKVDSAGHIVSAEGVLNGMFQDTINSGTNYELTTDEFNQAFVHEFGHFIGLDHSQANVEVLTSPSCSVDQTAGLPVMFPILQCPARVSLGLPALAPDDLAWVSYLYPVGSSPPAGKQSFSSAYGIITGNVYFSDGTSAAQGVNVLARQVDDPTTTTQDESLRIVSSSVSGYQFTGLWGQSVTCTDPTNPTQSTCTNLGGSQFGSRDPSVMGTYVIVAPPGTYTVSVESVNAAFDGGSGLNPLNPPIPMPGTAPATTNVTVTAGSTVTVNITLQGTPSTFDQFESAGLAPPGGTLWAELWPLWSMEVAL